MEFLLWLLGFCIAWIVGIVIGAFCIGQLLIIIFFSIPTSVRLRAQNILGTNKPIISDLFSLLIITVILVAVSFLVIKFFPKFIIGYFIGLAITSFMALGKSGANPSNLADYLENNERFLPKDYVEEIKKTLLGK